MAALLVGTALTGGAFFYPGAVQPVLAQQVEAANRSYNVAPQPLASALTLFGQQSGLQVSLSAATANGLNSPGVNGEFAPAAALDRLLSGTGLSWTFSGANTVIVGAPDAPELAPVYDGSIMLDQVDVIAMFGGLPADLPYETAGSSTYISAEQIERFRGTSPSDILRGIPGLTAAGSYNGGALNANIRGMQDMDRVPILVDGTMQSFTEWRGYAGATNRTYIDPDLISGVTVERGPSGSSSAIGGSVSMETLKATEIVRPGQNWGVRIKGGYSGNSVTPILADNLNDRQYGGVRWARIPTSGPLDTFDAIDLHTPGNFDRPDLFTPTGGNGSVAIAYADERFELLAAHTRRSQGNYFAGSQGSDFGHMELQPGLHEGQYYGDWGGVSPYRLGEEVLNTSYESQSMLAKGAVTLDGGHRLEVSAMRYEALNGQLMPSSFYLNFEGVPQMGLVHRLADTYTGTWTWNPEDNDLVDLKLALWGTDVGSSDDDGSDFSSQRWGVNLENTSRFYTDYGDVSLHYGASYNHALLYEVGPKTDPNTGETYIDRVNRNGWRGETSAFVNGSYSPLDWLTLDAGLRYSTTESQDDYGREGDNQYLSTGGLAPTATVTVEPWEGLQGYVRYAEAIRSPSLYEALGGSSFQGRPPFPLVPEHARNWEVGVNVMRDDVLFADDRLRFSAAWFDNSTDDYLTRQTLDNNQQVMVNLDSARFTGFEFSAGYDAGLVFADIAYNRYLSSEFCLPDHLVRAGGIAEGVQCSSGGNYGGFSPSHIPPRDMLSVTLGTRLFEEQLTVGGRLTYVGERMSDQDGRGRSSPLSQRWNPYSVVDVFASYEVNENTRLDLGIDNIGDVYHIDPLADGWNPGPGRTFRIGVTASF